MKRVKAVSFFVAVAIYVTIFASASHAVQDFSANVILKGAKQELNGKVRVGFCKIRVEIEKIIYIERTDLNPDVAWVIAPETKTYFEVPLSRAFFPWNVWLAAAWPYGEKLPELKEDDVVNGQHAFKYTMEVDLGSKSRVVGYVWVDKSSGVVLKMTNIYENGLSDSIEFNDIKISNQPVEFFEVPSGYTKTPFDEKTYSDPLRGKAV